METTPVSRIVQPPPDLAQEEHIDGLPLGTRGGVLIKHNFPLDADYDFSVFLLQNIVGYVTGLEYAHELEISIDGERVFLAPVGGEDDNRMSDENLGVAKDTLDARLKARIPWDRPEVAAAVSSTIEGPASPRGDRRTRGLSSPARPVSRRQRKTLPIVGGGNSFGVFVWFEASERE